MTLNPAPDGCVWPIDPACMDDSWESDFDEDVKDRAQALAGNTLRRLTAYRVGGCPITIRPADRGCWSAATRSASYINGMATYGSGPFVPINWAGTWMNCCSSPVCAHTNKRITLDPPMGGGVVVKIDGATLIEDTDYWVDGCDVIRMGANGWPMSQDLDLPDTQANTFSITYRNSYAVDALGAYACGKLAYQYALACTGGDCELPTTVTTLVREGVTYDLPGGSFPNGLTGIREVDAYIALWNPSHRKQGPRVWTP